MAFYSSTLALAGEAPPPSFERPVDLVHLARQTLGDRALEREILALFQVQARAIFAQLQTVSDKSLQLDLAHTLKGSARAVGAWSVAEAAQACEDQAVDAPETWHAAMADLRERIDIALAAIEDIRR
ncbi:Signal transduction histidine kinase, phosphotransfer (Hpt) domain containing protein [Rhabdaerophilaceae bacterium]